MTYALIFIVLNLADFARVVTGSSKAKTVGKLKDVFYFAIFTFLVCLLKSPIVKHWNVM